MHLITFHVFGCLRRRGRRKRDCINGFLCLRYVPNPNKIREKIFSVFQTDVKLEIHYLVGNSNGFSAHLTKLLCKIFFMI